MAEPPDIAWSDLEKAFQQLAGMVKETAGTTSDPSLRATLETMVNELTQGSQRFGVLLTEANAEIAAERASAGKFANDVLAANEQRLPRAEAVVAKREAFKMPTAAEPEADPGPRLCRELLDRYGFDMSNINRASLGWDTWLDATSAIMAPPPVKKPETVDEAEKEWQKLFESSLQNDKLAAPPPKPKPKTQSPGEAGWSTWLENPADES